MSNVSPADVPVTRTDRLSMPWLTLVWASIIIIAAAARIAASRDDFWFDEIWSWKFATQATSPWEIATRIRHDNNHILNTWIVFLLPRDTHWFFYRIPAVLAGIGTVILAGAIGSRRSSVEGLTALVLAGSSFVFIEYSSEARGYAYLLFFLCLCLWLMERIALRPSGGEELCFAISASCGFLAHFSFAAAYAGFVAWGIAEFALNPRWRPHRGTMLARLHILPVVVAAGLFCFNGIGMTIGGGNRTPLWDVILRTGSLTLGGPDDGWGAGVMFAATVTLSAAGMILLIRQRARSAWFWIVTTLALAISTAAYSSGVVYVRYFLMEIAGLLFLTSHAMSHLWKTGSAGKVAYLVLVGTILAGNGFRLTDLLTVGRGGYQQAVSYLQSESTSNEITLGSDHDFRNPMVLNYYHQRLANPKRVVYFRNGQWPSGGVDWVILHSFQQPPNPLPELQDANGNRYQLVKLFPYSGLSGWNWMLYQRVDLR